MLPGSCSGPPSGAHQLFGKRTAARITNGWGDGTPAVKCRKRGPATASAEATQREWSAFAAAVLGGVRTARRIGTRPDLAFRAARVALLDAPAHRFAAVRVAVADLEDPRSSNARGLAFLVPLVAQLAGWTAADGATIGSRAEAGPLHRSSCPTSPAGQSISTTLRATALRSCSGIRDAGSASG